MATLMIVDREETERTRIRQALISIKGTEILEFDSADSAAQSLFHKHYDLVLVDISSAAEAEWTFLGQLKLQHPKLPTLLLTTDGPHGEATVQALRMGAASFVPKSILAQDLVVTVERLLSLAGCRRKHSRLNDCLTRSGAGFVIENNDQTLVPVLVDKLMETAEDFGLCQNGKRMQFGVAVEEALSNAIVHGNLEIPTTLREQDSERFVQELEKRSQLSPYRHRQVRVETSFSETECQIVVADEGQGFDPNNVPNPTHPAHVHKTFGRGLFLIRAFMDEVRFNEAGNQITMIKRKAPVQEAPSTRM